MYEFFKNIAEKSNCSFSGVCSIHPSVSALYQVLLNEIREISFYVVKLKELGFTNKTAMAQCIEALSIFMINTNFNRTKYLDLVQKLYTLKKETKEKYISYCKQNELPCEIINSNFEIDKTTTTSQLIKKIESNISNKPDKIKQRLFELITIFAKLSAVNIVKIKKLDSSFDKYDYEILRFFALTNGYSIRNEKIKRRILEFSNTSLEIKEKLFKLHEERYGKKQDASITISPQKGHCILISGDDMDELEKLLKTLEKINPKEPVNVYTNGALVLAHFFPYFKNNKFLKGHYGSDNAQYDFSIFPGSVLITQNFLQKIDSLYKGEIFSNKIISFDKVIDIKNDDYTPLVEAALELEGFLNTKEKTTLDVSYDIDKIAKTLEEFKGEHIIFVAGKMDSKLCCKQYEDKKVVQLNCPLEMELLINSIKELQKRNVKITVFFAQCNLESLNAVASLLNRNIDIYLANCSYVFNPHIMEALKSDFDVQIL